MKKLIDEYRISVRRACRVCLTARSIYYFKPQGPRDDRAVRARIKEIAETRVRYGIARIHVLLRREGWRDQSQADAAHLLRRRLESAASPPTSE